MTASSTAAYGLTGLPGPMGRFTQHRTERAFAPLQPHRLLAESTSSTTRVLVPTGGRYLATPRNTLQVGACTLSTRPCSLEHGAVGNAGSPSAPGSRPGAF
jgi:hypothetical protein